MESLLENVVGLESDERFPLRTQFEEIAFALDDAECSRIYAVRGGAFLLAGLN